jgi:hypothetical protein
MVIETADDFDLDWHLVSEWSNQLHSRGGFMALAEILASIDREIGQLQKARDVLSGRDTAAAKKNAGRPRKTVVEAVPAATPVKKKKRNLSPEGRKRIAEAVRRRWAAQKKAAAAATK